MNREKAIFTLMNSNEYHHAKGDLPHSASSVEAFNMAIEALKEQRPHGEWLKKGTYFGTCWATCSVCNKVSNGEGHDNGFGHDYSYPNFCPNCGADMRKKESARNDG